ncbi:hypothetical protein GCM10010341_47770 [Streptomyces noursei]|nr:hypothetical protein GCM10010341_47770 [Streptomyces noursei]
MEPSGASACLAISRMLVALRPRRLIMSAAPATIRSRASELLLVTCGTPLTPLVITTDIV